MPKWHAASSNCQVFRPVRMLARHGLHLGFDVNAFLNSTPSRATRSKFGVFTHVLPYAPACCQPQSSKMIKRMFGREVSAARAPGTAIEADNDNAAARRKGERERRNE